MWFRLTEEVLKEYNEKQIEKFKQIYGESTYNLFVKSKDRLKNKGYSTDIDVYLKGSWKEEPTELKKLLNELDANVSAKRGRKTTAELEKEWEPKGNYIYYGKYKSYDVYEPLDVEASMSMGINTGWCTTGRYGHAGHPEFLPSFEDANSHWKRYTSNGKRLVYLLDTTTHYGKWAFNIHDLYNEMVKGSEMLPYIEAKNYTIDPNMYYTLKTNFTLYTDEDEDYFPLDVNPEFLKGINQLIGNVLYCDLKPVHSNSNAD